MKLSNTPAGCMALGRRHKETWPRPKQPKRNKLIVDGGLLTLQKATLSGYQRRIGRLIGQAGSWTARWLAPTRSWRKWATHIESTFQHLSRFTLCSRQTVSGRQPTTHYLGSITTRRRQLRLRANQNGKLRKFKLCVSAVASCNTE